MRMRDRLRRFVERDPEPQSVGLRDIARALLTDSDENAEHVAAVLARQRERKHRESAERAEQQAARERREASARWIADECKKNGFWFPSDYTGRRGGF
jgi:hypothetical protein